MSASIRTRRTLASGLSAVLVAAGAAAVAPAAHAATGPVTYSCTTVLGPASITTDIDSTLPGLIVAGEKTPITVTASGTLPGSTAKQIYDLGYRTIEGTVEATGAIDGAAVTSSAAIPVTSLGDQTTAKDVPFSGSGPLDYLTTTVGTSTFTAGDFIARLVLKKEGGTEPFATTVTCQVPAGKPPVIDTATATAKSTTALTLAKTTAGYGEAVTASAKVTTTGGSPAGSVAFVVDGAKTEVKLDRNGVADLVLKDLTLGSHQVSATFVPTDQVHYQGSADGPDTLTVVKAGTKTSLAVTGKRTNKVTRATAKVAGNFGTVPTGKVKFVLRKFGNKAFKKVKVKTLVGGKTSAGFGKIGAGRYKLRAVYLGDANHTRSKAVKKFRERRP